MYFSPLSASYIYISLSKKAILISANESREMILQYPPKGSKRFSFSPGTGRQSRKDCVCRGVGPSLSFQDPGWTELSFSASHSGFWLKVNFVISQSSACRAPRESASSPSMTRLGTSRFPFTLAFICKNQNIYRNSLAFDKLGRKRDVQSYTVSF